MDKSPCNTFLAMVMIKTIVFISVALNVYRKRSELFNFNIKTTVII